MISIRHLDSLDSGVFSSSLLYLRANFLVPIVNLVQKSFIGVAYSRSDFYSSILSRCEGDSYEKSKFFVVF